MMEFGEAVLFAKFLREHGYTADRYKRLQRIDKRTPGVISKENPGLWFKWLAYKATRLNQQEKTNATE
jgi:hypothetical protein